MKAERSGDSRGIAIMVLGMHRSATSMLARTLHARGCALSRQLLGANTSNPSGHWESTVAIDIDDRLLAALGRSWDDLRAMPQGWLETADATDARNRIRVLVNEDFKQASLWTIKEPRMCRLAPLWLDTIADLGFSPKVVIAVRHPFEVALSLLRRDGLPVAHGLLLWMRHLLEAEAATRAVPRLVVDHRQITSDWRGVTRRIGEAFHVQWPVAEEEAGKELDAVISPDRVSISEIADVADGQVPVIFLQLYRHALAATDGNWSGFTALAERFEDFAKVYDPALELVYRKYQALEAETRSTREAHAQLITAVSEKLDLVETLETTGKHLVQQGLRIEDLERWLQEAQDRIGVMDTELDARQMRIGVLEAEAIAQLHRLGEADQRIGLMDAELDACQMRVSALERQLAENDAAASAEHAQLSQHLSTEQSRAAVLEAELQQLRQSRSWRLTAPLRGATALVGRVRRRLGNGFRAVRFIAENPGDLRGVWQRAREEGLASTLVRAMGFARRGGPRPSPEMPPAPRLSLRESGAVVLTTRHCLYIARLIQRALEDAGISARIIQEEPVGGYESLPHFVICPQMFERLPGLYVAFQMEQSVSSRWFTDSYFQMLQNSFSVFDYSIDNIRYLGDKGLSVKQLYYLPIGYLPGYMVEPAPEEDYEVVFYGDVNCERRRIFLEALQERFRVKVLSEVYGDELRNEISRAKVVVNIHYYEGALLETTRIWECLSLGRLLVSERSSDMDRHASLDGLVDFVEVGDIAGMVERIAYWLSNESQRRERVAENTRRLSSGFREFDYFFHRFLLATDNLSFGEFWQLVGSTLRLPVDRVCLNLPEYVERGDDFQKDNVHGYWCIPGLRHAQGWVGCAMSYKFIMLLAQQQGMPRISICEDDVEFPEHFESRMAAITSYLDANEGQWDIFSGLMADFNKDARIEAVVDRDGMRYVHTDKLISTVFNIYSSRIFDMVKDWDEGNRDVVSNTIDRYIENQSAVRVITTDPFLVGHKEEQSSTIWGFENTQYKDMIQASQAILRAKVDDYFAARKGR